MKDKDSDIIKATIAQFGGADGFAKQVKAIYDHSSPTEQQEMLKAIMRLYKTTDVGE